MIWFPILVGLLVGGAIDHFVPREYIVRFLGQQSKKTILYSVGFGFLASACSHGILAIAMELYKKGASIPAVIAFLLASPWANLPITIILIGFFGWRGFLFIAFALVIAMTSGLVYQTLDRREIVKCEGHKVGGCHRIQDKIRSTAEMKAHVTGVMRGAWELSRMVLWWILIGMFLASIARAYIPQDIFMSYMGPTFLGMMVTLVLATVMEICSEGTAPVAFEIFRQSGAFGNSFIFLMAGVVTDYTEIGLIWSNIGKRAALLLPLVTVPQVLVVGYVFNLLL